MLAPGKFVPLSARATVIFNEIKTVTRAGMGSCGGKTCTAIIKRLFREEGIPEEEVTDQTKRPLFMEVPLEKFAGVQGGGK